MKSVKNWQPNSWSAKPTQQKISYPDQDHLLNTIGELSQLPPLVTPMEVLNLKQELAAVSRGEKFILQGGDCAESFQECRPENITNKLKILLQMSVVLLHGLRKPIVRVGRIAGQYAKPRSADMETRDGVTLPSYRGDLINKQAFDSESRVPNPDLLLQGYACSAQTLNYIRALVDSGFANLQHPENWDLDFVQHSPLEQKYKAITNAIGDAMDFMKTISGMKSSSVDRVDFYTSHEALHLPYEQALTRPHGDGYMNLGTHFPWIGMRTAALDEGHVEYMRGIANPIGVKVGPKMDVGWLTELVETLNPNNEPGKLMLIHRMSCKEIQNLLPPLIDAVKKTGINVVWSCDPMHGNTQTTPNGIKTRKFDDILSELKQAFEIHKQCGTYLGGVHIELTGDDVTECMGGARDLREEDLKRAYKTLVDPRLNYEQALEMAMLIAGE